MLNRGYAKRDYYDHIYMDVDGVEDLDYNGIDVHGYITIHREDV